MISDWKQQKNAAVYQEMLPEAVANITLEIMENTQTQVSNREINLCKSSESLMIASAVVAMENLPKIEYPPARFLDVRREKKNPTFCDITTQLFRSCVLSAFQ